jgi:hypothetical protein
MSGMKIRLRTSLRGGANAANAAYCALLAGHLAPHVTGAARLVTCGADMRGETVLKLDAPDRYSERLITNHDYPGDDCGYSGPGWSWLWLPRPFAGDHARAQFTRRIFKRHRTCQGDLRAFITEQVVRHDQRMAEAAGAALRENTAREFVLVCGVTWAFALYEVLSGQSSAEAGTAFYNGWVSAMNSDPQAQVALKLGEEPMIMAAG